MMKYLVILLSDQSTSFCHYNASNNHNGDKLIPIETLRNAIKYAFMEDLFIQFVMPSFALPKEYEDIIASTKAGIIAPAETLVKADVLVVNGIAEYKDIKVGADISYVLRIDKNGFFQQYKKILKRLTEFHRLNIVFTDTEKFTNKDFDTYKKVLNEFVDYTKVLILSGKTVQVNLLTDRLVESEMNNCNAGYNTITIAPDGQFYICPAFYYASEPAIGNLDDGLMIKNSQLYKLEYAPLCRECDAFQCKRCIFLNKYLTREVNIPSKEQCVMAHIERNASRLLLLGLREHTDYMPEVNIKELLYLDPFDNIKNK